MQQSWRPCYPPKPSKVGEGRAWMVPDVSSRYSRPERLRAAKGSACSPVMVRAGPKSCRRSLATDLRGWRRRHGT
eukprot:scaffold20834_cov59-Phaeocystis_antarctica.AAC.3